MLASWFALAADFLYPKAMTVEQRAALNEVMWVDPDRVSGAACFNGTRVPVQNLLDYVEGGSTIEDFLHDFPSVSRLQVIRFLELAKEHLIECAFS